MSDLRSSNIYDMLDEDGGASAAVVSAKKDTKSTPAEKPSSKKVDAPHKKEKPAKIEEPAAPLGKEQRGADRGRESKPRGRGRDNKGGLRRPAGAGREFDRRSGPSATHRNPRESKRHGAGGFNWGEPVEEGTAAANPVNAETPVSPPPTADETKTETQTTENKDAEKKEEEEKEKEDPTITYDQFIQKKQSHAPENDKLEARPVENDERQWVAAKPLASEKKSKKKTAVTEEEDKDEEKAEKTTRKKKNIVTLDEFNAHTPNPVRSQAPRESRPPRTETSERGVTSERGRRGARGRGTRGARGGGRGGRGAKQAPLVINDEGAFPKLGK